jgi:hypothetical protein
MSFNLDQFTQILSSIDRLFYMSESESIINISIGYYDPECTPDQLFRKLSFPLRNGKAEIRIYDYVGIFSYINFNGDTLMNIRFKDDIDGAYKTALNQILAFDRQHINQLKITEVIDEIEVLDDRSESDNSSLDEIRKIIAEGP